MHASDLGGSDYLSESQLSLVRRSSTRMDAMDAARRDGAEAAAVMDRKRKDSEEADEAEKIPFTKDSEKMKEEGDPKELKADRRSDSLYDQHLSRADSDARRDELSSIQSAAETVYSAFGNSAPRPMMNELPHEYRRRTAGQLRQHSKDWANIDLKGLSPDAMKVAAAQIFKDSFAAATDNETYTGNGYLHETRRTDPETGHRIKEFYGEPRAWMEQFMMPRQRARFDMDAIKRSMRGRSVITSSASACPSSSRQARTAAPR